MRTEWINMMVCVSNCEGIMSKDKVLAFSSFSTPQWMAGVDSGCGARIDVTRERDGVSGLVWHIDPNVDAVKWPSGAHATAISMVDDSFKTLYK